MPSSQPSTAPLPPSLVMKCDSYILAASGTVSELLLTHTENMSRALACKSRHDALVDELSERGF